MSFRSFYIRCNLINPFQSIGFIMNIFKYCNSTAAKSAAYLLVFSFLFCSCGQNTTVTAPANNETVTKSTLYSSLYSRDTSIVWNMKLSNNSVDIYSGCANEHLLKGSCQIDSVITPHIISIIPESNSSLYSNRKILNGIWEKKGSLVSMIFTESGEGLPTVYQSDSNIIITGSLPDKTNQIPNYPMPIKPGYPVTGWLEGGIPIYPVYNWFPVEEAETYAVQVAEDINFNILVVNACGLRRPQYQMKIKQLRLDFVYYWRVSATNQSGTSPWSPVFHFKTTFD